MPVRNRTFSDPRATIAWLMLLVAVAPAHAQTAREFGVASIKPAAARDHQYLLQVDASRLYARAASLRYLITEAYGIENYQLVGTAKWMNDDLYTINAIIPAPSGSRSAYGDASRPPGGPISPQASQ